MSMKEEKTLISIQLSKILLDRIKLKAEKHQLSVSAYLRLLAIKDIENGDKDAWR